MGLLHSLSGAYCLGLKLFSPSKMKHVAAYLLATLGGNEHPSAADVKALLGSVGIEEIDEEALNILIKEMDGKSAAEVIEAGKEKLAAVPAGGAAPAAGGAAGAAAVEAAEE